MSQQLDYFKPLALPNTTVVGEQAFAGDLLGREKLAKQLTGYLDRLQVGAVLAIDARWGEGKTWFGLNWAKYLESDEHEHKVVFIDAFAQDYIEDPFLLIAAEIMDLLDDETGSVKELREKAASVMQAILPVTTKALINFAGRVVLGSSGLSEDIQDAVKGAGEDTADATSKWVEKKLEEHGHEKESLANFRAALAKFAAAQDKPVIIFIDELDRCRPTFAVQLIERIKHFFDVPNLVFVLLLNREQLEKAIKGIYGAETDAATYLGKFVHLFLRLPKNAMSNIASHDRRESMFIKDVVKRYGFNDSPTVLVNGFEEELSQWADSANMSLRDIERACALFVMANVSNIGITIYLIVLKLKHHALYERLVRNDKSAHQAAIDLLLPLINEKKPAEMSWRDYYFRCLKELHELYLGLLPEGAPYLKEYGGPLFGFGNLNVKSIFFNAFNRIDLPVEN
ncbi:MAG: P-loop NTPase fold protein [Sulfuriferula sp.]|nr:P-loop NTPase fold protein [Sulfuriferula sp.]